MHALDELGAYLHRHYRGTVPSFLKAMSGGSSTTRAAKVGKSALLLKLGKALSGQRRSLLLGYVRAQVSEVLGEIVRDGIKPRQRLFDLGIDSFMAVELKNRLQSALEISLGATLVFDYPTVEAIGGSSSGGNGFS